MTMSDYFYLFLPTETDHFVFRLYLFSSAKARPRRKASRFMLTTFSPFRSKMVRMPFSIFENSMSINGEAAPNITMFDERILPASLAIESASIAIKRGSLRIASSTFSISG